MLTVVSSGGEEYREFQHLSAFSQVSKISIMNMYYVMKVKKINIFFKPSLVPGHLQKKIHLLLICSWLVQPHALPADVSAWPDFGTAFSRLGNLCLHPAPELLFIFQNLAQALSSLTPPHI